MSAAPVLQVSAREGHVEVLEWFKNTMDHTFEPKEIVACIYTAIENGCIWVLEWIFKNNFVSNDTEKLEVLVEAAITHQDLITVLFLLRKFAEIDYVLTVKMYIPVYGMCDADRICRNC